MHAYVYLLGPSTVLDPSQLGKVDTLPGLAWETVQRQDPIYVSILATLVAMLRPLDIWKSQLIGYQCTGNICPGQTDSPICPRGLDLDICSTSNHSLVLDASAHNSGK